MSILSETVAHQSRTENKDVIDAATGDPLPESRRPTEMGGLSVFSQKDLVETVSPDTVARALAESQTHCEASPAHSGGNRDNHGCLCCWGLAYFHGSLKRTVPDKVPQTPSPDAVVTALEVFPSRLGRASGKRWWSKPWRRRHHPLPMARITPLGVPDKRSMLHGRLAFQIMPDGEY